MLKFKDFYMQFFGEVGVDNNGFRDTSLTNLPIAGEKRWIHTFPKGKIY